MFDWLFKKTPKLSFSTPEEAEQYVFAEPTLIRERLFSIETMKAIDAAKFPNEQFTELLVDHHTAGDEEGSLAVKEWLLQTVIKPNVNKLLDRNKEFNDCYYEGWLQLSTLQLRFSIDLYEAYGDEWCKDVANAGMWQAIHFFTLLKINNVPLEGPEWVACCDQADAALDVGISSAKQALSQDLQEEWRQTLEEDLELINMNLFTFKSWIKMGQSAK